jgi:hypothetical protein
MSVKTTQGYDRAGLKTTKSLVTHVRNLYGKSVPESLKGEPASLDNGYFGSFGINANSRSAKSLSTGRIAKILGK